MQIHVQGKSFRLRVVLLAFLLVAIQLGAAIPLLGSIREEHRNLAEEQIGLAASAFSEHMQNRQTALTSVADILVKDFPIREAVALQEPLAIEDALSNLAARGEFQDAAVFDMSGRLMGGIGASAGLQDRSALAHFAASRDSNDPFHSFSFIGDSLYQTVSVPVREPITAPEASAWLTLGFEVTDTLARDIAAVIGHDATFVQFGIGQTLVYATTLGEADIATALSGVVLGTNEVESGSFWGAEFITQLGVLQPETAGLFVAIQRPVQSAMRAYAALRNLLLIVSGLALLATIVAAFWLSRTVTRPIGRLVAAAERMAEGIYSQPIDMRTQDEFAVLASGFNAMQDAIAQRERDIVYMARHDSLSGLPMREIILEATHKAILDHNQLAVANFVLHGFDELTSTLGQATADRLIKLVAEKIGDGLEEGQILGHLSRQEFVLVLPAADWIMAESCVRNIQSMLRHGFNVDDAHISLQIRAGVALYPEHAENAADLLRCAGIARSHASNESGSFGQYEKSQEAKSLERIRIVSDFPRALRDGDIRVAYQPKVDCESLELCGAEALVRWQHPERGLVSPEVFVEAIERAGGISQLTRWVLNEAAGSLSRWHAENLKISVAVNVSANDLSDDYLPDYLASLRKRFDFEPGCLTLEVTESAIMNDVDRSIDVITSLRKLGFRIAIDDFGTGHSSLAQIKRFPVDELKIDKSFVLNINDGRDEAVVRTAIELAHTFGLVAVAEGVENEVSLTRLRHLGCQVAQGYYFSKPVMSEEFLTWAKDWATGRGREITEHVEAGPAAQRA